MRGSGVIKGRVQGGGAIKECSQGGGVIKRSGHHKYLSK